MRDVLRCEILDADAERAGNAAQRIAGDDAIEHALLAFDDRVFIRHRDDQRLAVLLIDARAEQLRLRLRRR